MSVELTDSQQLLAEGLKTNGIIQFGVNTLKSGASSPIYLDARLLQRFPKGIKSLALDNYLELLRGLDYDLLAPVPVAAIAITSSLSDRTGRGMVTPRLDKKQYGTHENVAVAIDGMLPDDNGKRVALVDDVISTAGSKFEAITPLEAAGLTVEDVVVLLDRETGGREQLAQRGYNLHTVLTMRSTIEHLRGVDLVTTREYDQTMKFLDGRPWR